MVRISLVPALTPLYLYVSTFLSMCAVPNMVVFCNSLTSWSYYYYYYYYYYYTTKYYHIININKIRILPTVYPRSS